MHLISVKKICLSRPLIPLFLLSNTTNGDKPSADKEKLASNNKKNKPKDKLNTDEVLPSNYYRKSEVVSDLQKSDQCKLNK